MHLEGTHNKCCRFNYENTGGEKRQKSRFLKGSERASRMAEKYTIYRILAMPGVGWSRCYVGALRTQDWGPNPADATNARAAAHLDASSLVVRDQRGAGSVTRVPGNTLGIRQSGECSRSIEDSRCKAEATVQRLLRQRGGEAHGVLTSTPEPCQNG